MKNMRVTAIVATLQQEEHQVLQPFGVKMADKLTIVEDLEDSNDIPDLIKVMRKNNSKAVEMHFYGRGHYARICQTKQSNLINFLLESLSTKQLKKIDDKITKMISERIINKL